MAKKTLSFDPGQRYLKGFPGGNITQAFMIPNAIGNVLEHKMTITTGHVFEETSGIKQSFSYGNYAVKFGGYPTKNQGRNWFADVSFLKAFYGFCAEAQVEDGDEIDLILCIPINDGDKANTIRSVLNGEHWMKLKGQEQINFHVSTKMITFQGISAFFHFLLNLDGKEKISVEDTLTYGIDCGGKTFHEIMFNGLVDLAEGTGTTYDLGFWEVINDVHNWLKVEKGFDGSLLEVAHIIEHPKTQEDGTEKITIFLSEDIDLTEIVNEFSLSLVSKHNDIISRHGNLNRFKNLPIAGGTGKRFFNEYQKINSRFSLLPNPQLANVVGAYKFYLWTK